MERVIIITGDSSGMGKCLAQMFQKDSIVYGISRRNIDSTYKHYQADVLNYGKLTNICQEIYNKHHHIDMLICCAGLGVAGAIELFSEEEINLQLDVNLKGIINANKAVIPYMRENKSGRIVNISSVAAIAPMPFQALYSASKAAVNSYSMALANELKPFNVKVISVMPGDTKSGFTASRIKVTDKDNLYNNQVSKSTLKMENDELNGTSVEKVSLEIYKDITKKNPKALYTIGTSYKILVILMKILPANIVNKILYLIYANNI